MLLWYFLFFPHKQVVGSAERGKLFYMIDGLDASIRSMFACLRKSLWWGRRESSVCVKKKVLFCVSISTSAPVLILSLFDQGDKAPQHTAVGWKRDTQLLSSAVSAPPCQGHGEIECELGVLPLLIETGCHCHTRTERAVVLDAFCHPSYHSLRAWLGRDKFGEAVCHYGSEHFKKVKKRKRLFLLWDIIIQFPFSPWEHWKCPLLVYLLFQAEECPALVWQIWGHSPPPVSLLAAGAARMG